MSQNAKIPYISNVGAHELKPLFITGCAVTTVFFDLSFAADRWLRHRRRLAPNTSRGEKVLKVLTIVFAVVGTVGLILLSVFDTWRHNILHNSFLGVFIGGYILSAVFICWEYQLLRVSKYNDEENPPMSLDLVPNSNYLFPRSLYMGESITKVYKK